jgi:hypothetical protein
MVVSRAWAPASGGGVVDADSAERPTTSVESFTQPLCSTPRTGEVERARGGWATAALVTCPYLLTFLMEDAVDDFWRHEVPSAIDLAAL